MIEAKQYTRRGQRGGVGGPAAQSGKGSHGIDAVAGAVDGVQARGLRHIGRDDVALHLVGATAEP